MTYALLPIVQEKGICKIIQEYKYEFEMVDLLKEYSNNELIWNNCKISNGFLEYHLCKVNWGELCQNPNISEEFFERHLDKVDWVLICLNTNISEEFFGRHSSEIEWIYLRNNKNISEEFISKYFPSILFSRIK